MSVCFELWKNSILVIEAACLMLARSKKRWHLFFSPFTNSIKQHGRTAFVFRICNAASTLPFSQLERFSFHRMESAMDPRLLIRPPSDNFEITVLLDGPIGKSRPFFIIKQYVRSTMLVDILKLLKYNSTGLTLGTVLTFCGMKNWKHAKDGRIS